MPANGLGTLYNPSAARATAQRQSAAELAEPLNEFGSRLEEGGFARLASWPLEPRRTMMAELQSMRRLEVLFSELIGIWQMFPGQAARFPPFVVRKSEVRVPRRFFRALLGASGFGISE
jgi:hypothetical protein